MSGFAEPILLLGRTESAEMRELAGLLRELTPECPLLRLETAEQAIRQVREEHWYPELAIVCQSHSDEFSRADVDTLLGLLPLARWVCCFGVWCESDGRSRDLWPEGIRVPVRLALPRIERELEIIQGNRAALALTATREEVFNEDSQDFARNLQTLPVRIEIISPDQAYREALRDILQATSYRVVSLQQSQPSSEPTDLVLWDCDPIRIPLLAAIQGHRRRLPQAKMVGLMTLCYTHDRDALLMAGLDRVIAKLAPNAVLIQTLESLVRQS